MMHNNPNNLSKQEFEEFEKYLKEERNLDDIPEYTCLKKLLMGFSPTKFLESSKQGDSSVFSNLTGSVSFLKKNTYTFRLTNWNYLEWVLQVD